MKYYKNHTNLLGLIVVSSISLTACDYLHIGPKLGIKIPIEERKNEDYSKQDKEIGDQEVSKFAQLDNKEDLDAAKKSLENQNFVGKGKFVSQQKGKRSSALAGEGKYSLNFDAADLGEVSKIILTDMLQENYLMSPKVGGTVTLQTTKPLHREELLPTLEMLLRVNGAVLIKRDGIYRIEADGDSLQIANTSGTNGKKIKAGYQIKVIPLQYVGAADMAEIVTPMLPNKAVVKVDPARNILLVAGTQNELRKILDLVNTFDVNFIESMSFGLYPLENTDVANTVTEIEQVFNKGEKNPLSGMLRFIPIKHLNAILVVTQQKAYLKEAEKWIGRLDQESIGVGEGGVIVYKVQHVDAVELASTLSSVISGVASSTNKAPSVAPGQQVTSITNKRKKPPVSNRNRGNKSSGQANSALEGVNVIADEANNALIITAQPQQYRMLRKIIKQLDIMPLQVLVDAMIVSVTLTDDLQYGMQWKFKNRLGSDISGEGQNILNGEKPVGLGVVTKAADFALNGFSYGLVGTDLGVKATFNVLAKDNKINVISTPSIMVLNNHESTINVGLEVPSRGAETTNINGGANLNTSPIERIETGVTLTVKPRVNANGMVIMEIEQKVNEVVQDPKAGSKIDSPTILKREITSSVAVDSGESVVLGGLMNETHSYVNEGIPLLKDIPYLGWVFGAQGKKVIKEELMVIITPRVVQDKLDARKVTDEFKRKLSGIFYEQGTYKHKWNEVKRDSKGLKIKEDNNTSILNETGGSSATERMNKRPASFYP
ncbi:MAG: type II secretion system secretin GspD [Methylococcales bacterium]|nr:type II secretion system secretin GspD [Methylococcales bacterium]